MEYCIEARALKSSVLSQMGVMKPNCNDDVWCVTGINNNSSNNNNDDNLNFPVEDLLNLDFSEKEVQLEACLDDDEEKVVEERNSNHSSTTFSGEFESLSAAGELAVPDDDLENLEWLSRFVDDSTTELSLLCPVGSYTAKKPVKPVKMTEPEYKPVNKNRVHFLPSPVPRKPRSKRLRSNDRRPWYLSSPPLSAAESSTTNSSNGSSVLPSLGPLLFIKPVYDSEWFYSIEKPPVKKHKKQPEPESGRKCTHCQVNKTPQWRTGPLGPKTLCNACGVRYKSGRLFPEYRPACSPTFSREVHSNSHRKVLEMRLKKEMV